MTGLKEKLHDTRGASIMLALMAMLIATVAAAIVMASASAVSSSANQIHQTERAYLSVDSAVRTVEEAITGDEFKKQWLVHASREFLGTIFTYEDYGNPEYTYIDNGTPNPFRNQISNLVYAQMTAHDANTVSAATETAVISTYVSEDKTKVDPVLVTFSMSNSTGTSKAGYSVKAVFQSAEYVDAGSGKWDVRATDGYAATLLMKIGTFDGNPVQENTYLTKERLAELEEMGLFGDVIEVIGEIFDAISNLVMGSSRNQYYLYSSSVSWNSSQFTLQKGAN